MTDVNLIPGPRLAAKRRKTRLRLWALILALYIIVLSVGSLAAFVVLPGEEPGLAEELAAVEQDIARDNATLRELRGTLAQAVASLDMARAVQEQPDWSELLTGLSREMGQELALSHCQLAILRADGRPVTEPWNESLLSKPLRAFLAEQRYQLVLRGFGQTQESVSRLALELEGVGLFDRVRLVNSCRQKFLRSEAVAFTVECSF
jgi:hypothetical protein